MIIEILVGIVLAVMAVAAIMLVLQMRRNITIDLPKIWETFDQIEKAQQQLEHTVTTELAKSRDAAASAAKQSAEQLDRAKQDLQSAQEQGLAGLEKSVATKTEGLQAEISQGTAATHQAVQATGQTVRDDLTKSVQASQAALAGELANVGQATQEQHKNLDTRLEKLQADTNQKLAQAQAELAQKLEQSQATLADQINGCRQAQSEAVGQLENALAGITAQLDQLGTAVRKD